MFNHLFEPIKIGPVEIKNRIAMAPMNQQGDREGHPTPQYSSFYNARAVGGFGMLTTGSIFTNRSAREEYPFVPYLFPGSFNAGYWFDFVEAVHSMGEGTKIFSQLSPGFGRQTGVEGVRGASPIPFTKEGLYSGQSKETAVWNKYFRNDWTNHLLGVPREMTIEEIQSDVRYFVRSAELAVIAGFDGLEIHSCHGYLLHQFLSPLSNQRKDDYGGQLKNRARFLLEILTKTKENFGDTVPIVVRLSGREYQEGGLQPDDIRQIAIWCEAAGADAISLSNGSGYDDNKHFFSSARDNMELIEAQGKALKEVINIPVISVGLHTPEVAVKAIQEGETDMVALGRQAIADPDWPNKVKEGRFDEIIMCRKDNFCLGIGINGGSGSPRCTQNPNYGKEQYISDYQPKPMKGIVTETLRRWKPGSRR